MSQWADLATWRGPTKNHGGRRTKKVRGMCLHIAAGFYEGTISWQRNPAAEISSHFIVGRSGAVAQMVDTDDIPWTQSAGNYEWLTVEFEGFPKGHTLYRPGWEALSGFQVEAAAKLFARGHTVYGFPLQTTSSTGGYGLGHHSMGGAAWGGHSQCPGVPILGQKGSIVARAQAIAAPRPPAPPAKPPAAGATYIVRHGDTLSEIADRYHTTTAALVTLNHLPNPNLIWAGQVLRLPGAAPATHTVRSGDTLSEIADRYHTTTARLAALNRITNPNLIRVGQIIKLR